MKAAKIIASAAAAAMLCFSFASCSELRSFKYKLHGMESLPKNLEIRGTALTDYNKNKNQDAETELYEFKVINDDDGSEYAEVKSYNGSEVNVTVPTSTDGISVKAVGANCFGENESLHSVGIPYGVAEVGDYAFYKCLNLENAVLPSSLSYLGARAFAYCSSLEKIYIPKAVTYLGESAFAGCTSLKEIGISGGLSEILFNTFADCSSVTYIYIPRSVGRIEKGAFRGCTSLKRVDISENVTYIADDAFEGCPVVFACPKGSYAEEYAVKHGLEVYSLSNAQEQAVVDTAEDIADRSERELAKEESLMPNLSFGDGENGENEDNNSFHVGENGAAEY